MQERNSQSYSPAFPNDNANLEEGTQRATRIRLWRMMHQRLIRQAKGKQSLQPLEAESTLEARSHVEMSDSSHVVQDDALHKTQSWLCSEESQAEENDASEELLQWFNDDSDDVIANDCVTSILDSWPTDMVNEHWQHDDMLCFQEYHTGRCDDGIEPDMEEMLLHADF